MRARGTVRLVAVLAGTAGPATAQEAFTWQGASGGLWNVSTNWTSVPAGGGFPNGSADTATFSAGGGVVNVNGNFTVSGLTFQNVAWTVNNNGVSTNSINLAGTAAVQVDSTTAINTVVGGSGSLSKTGSGTLTLTGANTYGGATVLNGGTLSVSSLSNGSTAGTLGQSSAAAANLQFAGGTLQYTGTGASTDRLFQVGPLGATIEANGTGAVSFTNTSSIAYNALNASRGIALTGTNTGNNILAAAIADNGSGVVSVNKLGDGKWVLTGNNTFTGAMFVFGGTLQIGNSTPTGSLAGTDVVNLAAGTTLAFDRSSGNDTFDRRITGTGSLTVAYGSGQLTLTDNSTYSGTTAVTSGKLYSNGFLGTVGAGAVTVSSGATLGGNGVIRGGTTLDSGSVLDIGNGTANDLDTLTFVSNINVGSGARADFHFNDNFANAAGTGYDALSVLGTVTLGGTFNPIVNNTGSVPYSGTMRIINGGSLTAGTTFTGLANNAQITALNGFGGVSAWFIVYDYDNGDVFLSPVPVPEPGAVLGIAAAGLGLAGWVRRRRSTPSAPTGPRLA